MGPGVEPSTAPGDFWRKGHLTAYALRPNDYQEVAASEVLPGIDLDELGRFLDRPAASQAIHDCRSALRRRSGAHREASRGAALLALPR